MKVKFNATFEIRGFGVFGVGVQETPDELAQDKDFAFLVQHGAAEIIEAPAQKAEPSHAAYAPAESEQEAPASDPVEVKKPAPKRKGK